jgi:predicted permease
LALGCNVGELYPDQSVFSILEMGAHASMVVQLIIFGIFLASVKFSVIDKKLNVYISMMKFVAIPLVGWGVAWAMGLSGIAFWVVILELCVPLAVANLNLASLYGCRPTKVAEIILISSIVFVVVLVVGVFLNS